MSIRIQKLLEYDRLFHKGAGSGEAEHFILYGLLRMLNPEKVLEIGVSRGHMTSWLALALEDNASGGKLISVDNWSRAHGGEATSPARAQKRLHDNKIKTSVDFVKSDSVPFMESQETDSFDFVWVDGDHSFEGAKADILQALRICKPGGTIAVHDTHQQYSGVRDAINNIQELRMIGIPRSGLWVKGGRGIWITEAR